MRKHIYVDGTDLATFGVYVSGQGTYGSPEKEVTTYTVPGRDGLVLGVNERLENIQVTYPCFIYTSFAENMKKLRSFLLSRSGYVRIEDDYDTGHFRLGFFEARIAPDVTARGDAGSFNLTFNCQPQRWLKSGETVISRSISTSATITIVNETEFTAKPFLRIYGYGAFYFFNDVYEGGRVAVIIDDDYYTDFPDNTYLDIDCETMEAYCGDNNLSQYVGFTEGSNIYGVDAPVLVPGTTTVRVYSGQNISRLEITPRWWEA